MKEEYCVKPIETKETKPWLLDIHYAKRMPSVMYAFGLFRKGVIVGVVTYGMPASPRVCDGVCGKEYSDRVIELNRLCLLNNRKNEASMLVSGSLKMLPRPKIVISYSDTSMDHVGYIYQATNWIYLGLSAKRGDRIYLDGTKKHGRHVISTDVENIKEVTKTVPRPRKHRYVLFLGSKREKKEMRSALKYDVKEYPKGESKRYEVKEKKDMFSVKK